jgi:hypothetical protein
MRRRYFIIGLLLLLGGRRSHGGTAADNRSMNHLIVGGMSQEVLCSFGFATKQ